MSYAKRVSADEINELIAKLDAVSNVVSIVIDSLGETQPVIQKKILTNIREEAEDIRSTLGEVDEADIVEYACAVAEYMYLFSLSDEDDGITKLIQ